MKTNTIKKVDTVLRGMLTQAVKNEILLKNPCNSVEIPKTEKEERRVLTLEEQEEFLQYVRTHARWRKYNTLFTVALATGLRIGELLALNWSDIDFSNKTITVTKTLQYLKNKETGKFENLMQTPKTKTSKRTIPLLDSLIFILKKYRREQQAIIEKMGDKWNPLEKDGFRELVFTTEFGRPFDRCSINRVITSVVEEINETRDKGQPFEDFTPHTLRHTFATRCFENGIPPKVVQGYLGHATLQMTMDLYTHVMEETKTEEIKKLEKVFRRA